MLAAFPKHSSYARKLAVHKYRFRPLDRADLPTLERWLQTPEVVRWWGDAARELALLTEDLDQPLMVQWIVEVDAMPFAYAQGYCVHSWPQKHLEHLPADAWAIDAFIGVPEMLDELAVWLPEMDSNSDLRQQFNREKVESLE